MGPCQFNAAILTPPPLAALATSRLCPFHPCSVDTSCELCQNTPPCVCRLLFCEFLPTALQFFRRVPFMSRVLDLPLIKVVGACCCPRCLRATRLVPCAGKFGMQPLEVHPGSGICRLVLWAYHGDVGERRVGVASACQSAEVTCVPGQMGLPAHWPYPSCGRSTTTFLPSPSGGCLRTCIPYCTHVPQVINRLAPKGGLPTTNHGGGFGEV